MTKLKLGVYRHYKGDDYELLGEAILKELKQEKVFVYYKSLKDDKVYLRSKENFLSQVVVNKESKESKARFEFIKESEPDSFEQRYLRALADYQNLLKQSNKDRLDFVKFAVEDFLNEILPVYDHLKLSIKSLKPEEEKSAWVEGVRCVLKEFKSILEKHGVEEIKTEGQAFNHDEMEAVEGEGALVDKEVMPGYKMHGKVIKIAKVTVK